MPPRGSSTPLRVPQILGGSSLPKNPVLSSIEKLASNKTPDASSETLDTLPTFPCSHGMDHLLDLLIALAAKGPRVKPGARATQDRLRLLPQAAPGGCPGFLMVYPGYYKHCQIYYVNFVYRQALVLVNLDALIVPLALIRVNSYASLNGVLQNAFYESFKGYMTNYELGVYTSAYGTDPGEKPIVLSWRQKYITPASPAEGQPHQQNRILLSSVSVASGAHEYLIDRLKELLRAEYEHFVARHTKSKQFPPTCIDIDALEKALVDDISCSMSGLVSLQKDKFALLNSYFLDAMMLSSYSPILYNVPERQSTSDADSDITLQYDTEGAELHTLASLYKFVIARDIVNEARLTSGLDIKHQFYHMRLYSRLTLCSEGDVQPFISSTHKVLDGIGLWCKPMQVSPRFQAIHTKLSTCSKFDPELISMRNNITHLIDHVLTLLTPLPTNAFEYTEKHLISIFDSILILLEIEISANNVVAFKTIRAELQALLNPKIAESMDAVLHAHQQIEQHASSAVDDAQKANVAIPNTLEAFLEKHIPRIFPRTMGAKLLNGQSMQFFMFLLPKMSIAERCYLARCYFVESVVPLLLSHSISSFLQKYLLTYFADCITYRCISDSTFSIDFCDALKTFRHTLPADVSESQDECLHNVMSSQMPMSIINTACYMLTVEKRGLSSSALLVTALDFVWPRLLRTLVEQVRALIETHLTHIHGEWSTWLLRKLSPIQSALIDTYGTNALVNTSQNFPDLGGPTKQSIFGRSFSLIEDDLLKVGISPYATESSLLSIASVVLTPYLCFDPADTEKTLVYYLHDPMDCIVRKARCLLLSDTYGFMTPSTADISQALMQFFKQILRSTATDLVIRALDEALGLNPDGSVMKYFASWLQTKAQYSVLADVDAVLSTDVSSALPSMYPLPRPTKQQPQPHLDVLPPPVPPADMPTKNQQEDYSHSRRVLIDAPNDEAIMDSELISAFSAFVKQLSNILSRHAMFGSLYRVCAVIMSADVMQEKNPSTEVITSSAVAVYSAPPECIFKIRMMGGAAEVAVDAPAVQIVNPYTGLTEVASRTDAKPPLAAFEAQARQLIHAVLAATCTSASVSITQAAGDVDPIVLIVHAAAELVSAIDISVQEVYSIPSYATLGFVTINLVDFKSLLITALGTVRNDIQTAVCTRMEQISDYMIRVMKLTETMLGTTTVNLDKLSHILVTMENHRLFMQQWTPVSCYLCNLLVPIAKLRCSYLSTSNADIRTSICVSIPAIYGPAEALGTDDTRFTSSVTGIDVSKQAMKLCAPNSGASGDAPQQRDEMHIILQAATLLGRVNCIQKDTRTNYKRHIRVFSRLLLIFSDWLSKIMSTLRTILSEVLKMQLSDFTTAVVDPLQFKKAFPTFCKDLEIPYLESMYTSFEGNDMSLALEFIKTLQAYTCIRISVNSDIVNGFSIEEIQKMAQIGLIPDMDKYDKYGRLQPTDTQFANVYSILSGGDSLQVYGKQVYGHRVGWKLPDPSYHWPYQYKRPTSENLQGVVDDVVAADAKEASAGSIVTKSMATTDCSVHTSERCDILVLRDKDGLVLASGYVDGHFYEESSPEMQTVTASSYCSSCYDSFRMYLELYIIIEEVKNLYTHAEGWSKALNIDLHLVDSPTDIEATLLPLCLLVTSFIKLRQLHDAALSKTLIDLDTGVLVQLLEICANAISSIRSSFAYSNWSPVADHVEEYLKSINPQVFLLHFLASPDAIDEDLANFGEGTGLNTFLRGVSASQSVHIDTYFEPDRTILVEHIMLYDKLGLMFDAAAMLYNRGLVNKQAMVTLQKIDKWVDTLNFQTTVLESSPRAEAMLSTLYSLWNGGEKDEFMDPAVIGKIGPVFGGEKANLTAMLRKIRALMVMREKLINMSIKLHNDDKITVIDSATTSPATSTYNSTRENSVAEDSPDHEQGSSKSLRSVSLGSNVFEGAKAPKSTELSFIGSFSNMLKPGGQSSHVLAKDASFSVPIIVCTRKHITDIQEALFVVEYVLFNDYSPSTQTIARRLEVELTLMQTLAMNIYRAMLILPDLLLLLPDLRDISKGVASPRLKAAFPPTQDPFLEVISTLNIMRHLHNLCFALQTTQSSITEYGSDPGASQTPKIDGSIGAAFPILGTGRTFRAIIKKHSYLVRALSIHINQAGNILSTFTTSILNASPIPLISGHPSFNCANVPTMIVTFYSQSQQHVIDLIKRSPLIRNTIFYNNTYTSTSVMLPSGQFRPLTYTTSQNAFSNPIYDILTVHPGQDQFDQLKIRGIRSGYEQLIFKRPVAMPDNILHLGASIFAPKVHQTAMFREYLRSLYLLTEGLYVELITNCIYQCVLYAFSTLIFIYLDGSPGNFLQLYYKIIPAFKRAIATVAVEVEDATSSSSLSSYYSIWSYKEDRRLCIQALLARVCEHEHILRLILEESITFYIMNTTSHLSQAAVAARVASFMDDETQVRNAVTEIYSNTKGSTCKNAMACGIHPGVHTHHIASTLLYGLPSEEVFSTLNSLQRKYGSGKASGDKPREHMLSPPEFSLPKSKALFFVSCSEAAIPIVGQYMGKASLLDCIPLNYRQLQVLAQLGKSMHNRIPTFLVGDAIKSYANPDYLLIVHALCRYFGMRYEFIFCSPSMDTNALIHSLSTKILAGYYVVLCGMEYLDEAQLNSLSNMLSNYNTGTGTIPTLFYEDGRQFNFSIVNASDVHEFSAGGYAICLPEAIYEHFEFTLTSRGSYLKKLFPVHQMIELHDFGVTIPGSLISQTRNVLYSWSLNASESDEKFLQSSVAVSKDILARHRSQSKEQRISSFNAQRSMTKEYYYGSLTGFAILAPDFDAIYPHLSIKGGCVLHYLGHIFAHKSAQYGSKLYEIAMFLNTLGLSTPQLLPEDLDLVLRRCKDATSAISVATTLATLLLSQTALRSIRDMVARVIVTAFALPQQQQSVLKSVISLLNVVHCVQEADDDDIGMLLSKRGSHDADYGVTSKNIGKVWKTLKQMYTSAYAELCEDLSQKSGIIEPIGIDFVTLCLDMLMLGPVFLLPPQTTASQSSQCGDVSISQLNNRSINAKAAKSGILAKITQRQTHFQFLMLFAQFIAKVGKLRPFFIHSLIDLHENIRTIMNLGSQALLIFICNPPNGTMTRSILSAVLALQSYYPVIDLQFNIKAKFDFYNKPRCLLLTSTYEDISIINSNLACVQRRLVVVPEYLKFTAMFNTYVSRHLHLTENSVLVDKARQFFTVTSLLNMKSTTLAGQYLQSLCMKKTTLELRGECLAERRLQLGNKLFAILITYLTDEMMHSIFNIIPNPVVWMLYRQLLIMFLAMFDLVQIKARHPEACATFSQASFTNSSQMHQTDGYFSLHSVTAAIPLTSYDSDMHLQGLPRAAFFDIEFSIDYLQYYVYEAPNNQRVICSLFLPIYAAIFNSLHVLYLFYFKKPTRKIKKVYKKGLVAFVYRPERFVQKMVMSLEGSPKLITRTDIEAAIASVADIFPEHYADEEGDLSVYSYLSVARKNGSHFRFVAKNKDEQFYVRHFPYTCSSALFKGTMFTGLFEQQANLQHELVLAFDCERVMFTIYLTAFIMAKLPVCVLGETYSGKTTYIRAAETLLSSYVRREHIALFDTDSFEAVLKKLVRSCYLHNVHTSFAQPSTVVQPAEKQAEAATKDASPHDNATVSHPLASRKLDPGAKAVIGCPISILDVVEDNILLDDSGSARKTLILDIAEQKLPMYHITIANLMTNTATCEMSSEILSAKDGREESKLFTLETLARSNGNSQSILQNDRLAAFLGEKFIIFDPLDTNTTCSLTGVLGSKFSAGVFAPNISIVVETAFLHDFLLASQINFVQPPLNNTRDFLLLLLKRNFQHPSLAQLQVFAPKIVHSYENTSRYAPQPADTESKPDCNTYVGIKKPETEFLHEYSDTYFLQFIEGMLLIEELLPISIIRVIAEMKRLQQYTSETSLADIQLHTITLGSLIGALRNISSIKHIHMAKIMDELASAVTIGRLSPTGPFGPMNPENMTRFLRTNTLLASGLFAGVQTFPSWEIQVLDAAFKESPFNKGVSTVEVSQAFAGMKTLDDDQGMGTNYHFDDMSYAKDHDDKVSGNKYKNLIAGLSKAKPYYTKLFFYNPHERSVNKCIFKIHLDVTRSYLLNTVDPTIINRAFVLLTDISVLMEHNSLEIFRYIKYLRNPGLFSKLHSPEEVSKERNLALRLPVFLMLQSELPGSFYTTFLQVIQGMGNYKISNRKTFMKITEQVFSAESVSSSSDSNSQHSSQYSSSIASTILTGSNRSVSEYSIVAPEYAVKNPDIRAFLALIEEPTEAAIKRRQRILIDVQVMIQSITTQSSVEAAVEEEHKADIPKSVNSMDGSTPKVTLASSETTAKDLIIQLTDLLVSVLNSQTEAVASYYIIRAAVLMALGISPLLALRDFTPTLALHGCSHCSSVLPEYLFSYLTSGNIGLDINDYTELFLMAPTDIMVTIPMSLFNAILNKSAAIGVLSMVEMGSSLLSLFSAGETHILGALLAKYLCLPSMLSEKEITNILSRSFSIIVFADTSIAHPLPLRELPIIRHTIDENDMISSLQMNGDANVIANAFSTSETAIPSLQLIRSIPHFVLASIPYNFSVQPFIARHEGAEAPLHLAYSDMYCEVFCRTTLYVYNCCMQNVITPIPYSLARFSEVAAYYTTEIINKYLKILLNIQKLLSTITLLDNGIRNELFAPAIRNNIIALRDQFVSLKLKLKLDFVRAVVLLQNACCDGPLIAARLLFYPFTISAWGNCIQFEMGLFECLKNRKITNNSLNVSYSDNSTAMLQSLFNLPSNAEILHQTDVFSNYGLPSRLLMLCEDLMVPKWKTQLISSLCNPDPELVQEIILLIQYVRLGFKFLFTTADLSRIVIPACEVYFLNVELDRCKTRLASLGVDVSAVLEQYRISGTVQVGADAADTDLHTDASGPAKPPKGAKGEPENKNKTIHQAFKQLKSILEKIRSFKYQAISQKDAAASKSFLGTGTGYDYRAVYRDLLIYIDCHLPPPLFEALLRHALLQNKPIVFLNFGSMAAPFPNIIIVMKTVLLVESRMTKKNAKVFITTAFSVYIVKPLHEYRIYYVMAPNVPFTFLLQIGFIGLHNCDLTTLNAPKFQFKSNTINLLEMQRASVTEYELRYKLREIAQKYSSFYSLYTNGFDGLEIIHRESCLDGSERLQKYMERIVEHLDKHILSRKEVMNRLIKRDESNNVFIHLQQATVETDGFDFSKLNMWCVGIDRQIEYRREIAEKIAESSTISDFAKYFGRAITSVLLLLRQMSLIHVSLVTAFTDYFFAVYLQYLENRAAMSPSRSFTAIICSAHHILENTMLLIPRSMRPIYLMLFMATYHVSFNLALPDDLTHLKTMMANNLGFFVSHFSDKFNTHLPLYNQARQVAASCPASFRCSPNVVYSWRLFSLLAIYNPQRFGEWYEYFMRNKAVFTLLNFSGDAYKMIIGTYLYKERALSTAEQDQGLGFKSLGDNSGAQAASSGADDKADLASAAEKEAEENISGALSAPHVPIIPPYIHKELEGYSTRSAPLPPSLQYPSLENTWAALLLIISLRQDLIPSTMDLFCRITPPSAVHEFLTNADRFREKAQKHWDENVSEQSMLSTDIFSQIAVATAKAMGQELRVEDIGKPRDRREPRKASNFAKRELDPAAIQSDPDGIRPIDFSAVNPANLDHVTALFNQLQSSYSYEATRPTSSGHGSRIVLLYYDEGLAIMPCLRTLYLHELVPAYGFPEYVCQPVPSAECLATNVVFIDTQHNPSYSLTHLTNLHNSGARPAHIVYVLVPLPCCQKFGVESGAGTENNLGMHLATFIETCKPVQLFLQRPTSFVEGMCHIISLMKSCRPFQLKSVAHGSCLFKAVTVIALRYSILVSTGRFKVDDNESLQLYMHLISQIENLPRVNRSRRLFFKHNSAAVLYNASSVMMHSTLNQCISTLNVKHFQAGAHMAMYYGSAALMLGAQTKLCTGVVMSYLNNKLVSTNSLYEGAPQEETLNQNAQEGAEFDGFFSSVNNSETELSASQSVVSRSDTAYDNLTASMSIGPARSEYSHMDMDQLSTVGKTSDLKLSAAAVDEVESLSMISTTGPDKFNSYTRAELQKFLSTRRNTKVCYASTSLQKLLNLPETMTETDLTDFVRRIQAFTVELEKFAARSLSMTEILHSEELQTALADTMQPIRLLRPELTSQLGTIRDSFSFLLSENVIANLSEQTMSNNIYSTNEIESAERALPPLLYSVLLLSKSYARVRKLTYSFTRTSGIEQPHPIKVLSSTLWTIRGDIYQPIMSDVLKWFKLQICSKYSLEMERFSIIFTILDPTHFKDYSIRYDSTDTVQCAKIEDKRHKQRRAASMAALKITNMRLYGIGYDYILNTIVDVSHETANYPNNCDIYAMVVPCESPSNTALVNPLKIKDSHSIIREVLNYKVPSALSEEAMGDDDQDFGIDHFYENSFQYVTIPVDFPGCWQLILQNKTSLTNADVDMKFAYCGTGYF